MKKIVLLSDKEKEDLFKATALKIGIRHEAVEKDVIFKQKFYYSKRAHYETATLGDIMLVPKESIIPALRSDYKAMENMIYGDVPVFDDILTYLSELQSEIHSL